MSWKLPYQFALSVTQIDLAGDEGCLRAWGLRYLNKVKLDKGNGQLVGIRGHEIAEAYQEHGTLPDLTEAMILEEYGRDGMRKPARVVYPGQIMQAGIPFLPKPGTAKVEGQFYYTHNGIPWGGAMDLEWVDPDDGLIVIGDHKFTKDHQYIKSPYDLTRDTQPILYSWRKHLQTKAEVFKLRWFYYLTKGHPECVPVNAKVHVDHVYKRMKKVEKTGRLLLRLYNEKPDGRTLLANPAHCDKFGGCKHRNTPNCRLTLADMESEYKMTFEEMAAHKFGGATPPPAAVPPPAVVAAPPPAAVPPPAVVAAAPVSPFWVPGDPLNPAQEWLAGQGKPNSVIAAAANVPPPDHIAKAYDFGGVTERTLINSPEAPPYSPASPEQMPPAIVDDSDDEDDDSFPPDDLDALDRDQLKTKGMAEGAFDKSKRGGPDNLKLAIRKHRAAKLAGEPGTPPPVQMALPPSAAVLKELESEETRVLSPAAVAALSAEVARVEAAIPPAAVTPPPPVLTKPIPGIVCVPVTTLYIGCSPEGVQCLTLGEIIRAVMPQVLDTLGVRDYRCADFRKGAGVLTAAVREYVTKAGEQASQPLSVVTDKVTPEGIDTLATLRSLSCYVVS